MRLRRSGSALVGALLAMIAALMTATPLASAQDRSLYGQQLRPQFHFSPATMFTNDPNGLVYYRGKYHLFYQQRVYTGATGLSCCDWGHAVSRDLIHWEQRPVAINRIPGTGGQATKAIFSGSAVVDWNNTSGFGTAGSPPLVAIYTLSGGGNQSQALAYSADEGETWTPYAGNPVLDIGSGSFRDPKVFWHEPTKRWVMVIYGPNTGVRWYSSPNLKDWTHESSFPTGFECPDFFPLNVDDDPNKQKWLLFLANGSYYLGDFDGKTFTPDSYEPVGLMDYGQNYYAAQTFSDTPGRRILVGWIATAFSRNGLWLESPWMGSMTIGRELALKTIDGRPQLVSRPVDELTRVRSGGVTVTNKAIPADASIPLDPAATGNQLDIEATLDPGSARDSGLRVFAGQGFYTTVGYDSTTNEIYIDRSRSGRQDGLSGNGNPSGRVALPVQAKGKPISLRVLADRSSLEVYADGGSRVLSANVFPLMNTTTTQDAATGATNLRVATTANFQVGQTLRVNADSVGPRPGVQAYTITDVGTGSVNTALAAPLAAGSSNLKVTNITNIQPGSKLTIGTGDSAETLTVAAGGVGTAAANATTLLADAAAGATNIKVASVNGFTPGATVSLSTAAGLETATVAPGGVGTQGNNTVLSAPGAVGDTNVKVNSVNGMTIGGTVIVGFGAAGAETRTIVGPVGANGAFNGTAGATGTGIILSAPLDTARAQGAALRSLGTGITLTAPLSKSHMSGAAARSLGTGVTATTSAARDHQAADTVMDLGTGLTISPALASAWPTGTPVSTPLATGLGVFASGGSATITSAKVYNMRSIWLETQGDRDVSVGGTVPSTLSLSLGAPASFGAFAPGLTRDYTASTSANVISTAGDAILSVSDASSAAPGRLVNGSFALHTALQARAASAGGTGRAFADIGPSTTPTALLSYAGPVSNDGVTVTFQQRISNTDALRTGAYSKTLTFTLSTATP